MPPTICPHCGVAQQQGVTRCQFCGSSLRQVTTAELRLWIVVVLVLVAGALVVWWMAR